MENLHSEKIKKTIELFNEMIRLEMISIQTNIKLIQANQSGHFTLNKIIVKDARQSIGQSREMVKSFSELKRQQETKLMSIEPTFTN